MAEKESRLAAWMHNGRLSFLAWLLVLCIYTGFRFAGIDATELTNMLIALTGVFVGNLGIAQGRRAARTEERTMRTEKKVEDLEVASGISMERADASEKREEQWKNREDDRPPPDGKEREL